MSNITGNKIVDEISALHINSIPETWYHTIKRNNQPHAMAILVLWDLVYWYKWTEVRDEASGLVIGYKKKFKADLLQRSYEAISNKFGISKRQATDIIVFLEKIGAVKRVFRNIRIANTTLSNVLFIELIPSVIKELCNANLGEVSHNGVGGSHADSGDSPSELGETYTTTSTTNTTIISNSSTSLKYDDFPEPDDSPTEATTSKKKSTRSKKNVVSADERHKQYLSSLPSEINSLSEKCADKLVNYLIKLQNCQTPAANKLAWQEDFARFLEKESKPEKEILAIIDHAMTGWWSDKIASAKGLLKEYGRFYQQIYSGTSYKSNYQKKRDGAIERTNMITDNDDEYKIF